MEHYADPMDRATVESERLLEEQLRVARSAKPVELPYTGKCHNNCGAELPVPARFCDSDCRDDYEKLKRSRLQRPVQRR